MKTQHLSPFLTGLIISFAALQPPLAASAVEPADLSLTNEQGTLCFTLLLETNGLTYRVDHLEGTSVTPVIGKSPLGLTRTDTEFTNGFQLVSASPVKMVDDNYTLVTGKQLKIHSRGVERTFAFNNADGLRLTLTVRAYPDGVAFRYGLPGHGTQLFQIIGESTGFKLPDDGRVWTQPYSHVGIWAPAYEADYVNGVPVGTPAPAPEGWSLPLLCQDSNRWVLITESGLGSDYFAVHLQPQAEDGLYRVRLPETPETFGVAPQAASITLPWVSPWRLIIVADRAGGIAESTLVTDLARPSELKDTSWIKPGVSSWSWWSDMSSPYSYPKLKPFIDESAELGWPYSTIDLGWQDMQGGNIQELAAYAKARGVGLFLWYNSGGRHNESPEDKGGFKETLRNVLSDSRTRDAEFARLAAMGIKGVKIDFMQSDKQFIIASYHDILRDAARHRLMVDFHGSTFPHGWRRTFPNLVSMEGVRGEEQYWDQTYADNAQTFDTIYVFTRNAIGPMDYTPTDFADVSRTNPSSQPHLTTVAHELALLVVFESGVQHVIDPAGDLMARPAFLLEYLHDLPTAWDESHVVEGAPGELAVLARRHGTTWYLSGINGEKTSKMIQVPLTFLGNRKYEMTLITDGATRADFAYATRVVGTKDNLEIHLLDRGGFAARLTPK